MALTRRVNAIVKYAGNDITQNLEEYISKITVTDNFKDQIDDVSIALRNDTNRFLKPNWALDVYEELDISIITENWKKEDEGKIVYPVGIYNIDSRDFSRNSVGIKALAIPLGEAQDQTNSKSWVQISMSKLGLEIANKYNLEFKYMVDNDPILKNVKQEKETDFSFLKKIVSDEGAILKIAFNNLIIFDETKFEEKAPKFKLSINDLDYRITEKTKEIYDAAEVTYIDPKTNRTEKVMVTATTINKIKSATKKKLTNPYEKYFGATETKTESNPYGKYFGEAEKKTAEPKKKVKLYAKILKLNKRSKSGDLAEFARKKLKKENTKRVEISFSIIGDMGIYSGDTFELTEAGIFNGKYLVNKIIKNIPGFKFEIESYLVESYY
ncbi:MAG: phage late control D family protein [Fusobacteriaceae bacterium]